MDATQPPASFPQMQLTINDLRALLEIAQRSPLTLAERLWLTALIERLGQGLAGPEGAGTG